MKTGIYLTAAFVIVALLFTWGSIEGAKVKEEKDRFRRDRICHIDIKDITSGRSGCIDSAGIVHWMNK